MYKNYTMNIRYLEKFNNMIICVTKWPTGPNEFTKNICHNHANVPQMSLIKILINFNPCLGPIILIGEHSGKIVVIELVNKTKGPRPWCDCTRTSYRRHKNNPGRTARPVQVSNYTIGKPITNGDDNNELRVNEVLNTSPLQNIYIVWNVVNHLSDKIQAKATNKNRQYKAPPMRFEPETRAAVCQGLLPCPLCHHYNTPIFEVKPNSIIRIKVSTIKDHSNKRMINPCLRELGALRMSACLLPLKWLVVGA